MSDAEDIWKRRSDEQILDAAQALDEYTDEGRRLIHAELLRRGIGTDPVAIQDALSKTSAVGDLASLGDRLLGQILDSAVAIAALAAAFVLFDVWAQVGQIALVASFVFCVLYILFADGLRNGQSYGKRVVKTAVVDATSGAPCSWWQSFIRNLLLSILGVIDWVFIFGKRRQRLGDKLAHTVVIYAGRKVSDGQRVG
jgi:uncharacterized RDD family membrane protein YckC